MKILVACEESQIVTKEFRKLGHEAFSCDILPCSGGHPEWHIKQDVIPLINGNCEFNTSDKLKHKIDGEWDLIIAHPPCTYLCLSGQQWCNIEKYGEKAVKRLEERKKAIEFFMKIINAKCEKICVENPVGIINRYYKKPTQYIHPYEFGHGTGKRTGLWLKNLSKLKPTNIVPIEYHISKTGRKWDKWFWESSKINPLSERSKFRSKTFPGIALAMASQWTEELK